MVRDNKVLRISASMTDVSGNGKKKTMYARYDWLR
jgi:hypothetical protein